jgi:hypothetical protein
MSHFRRAHDDENDVVDRYFQEGNIALRVPISAAGRFKGDVLVILRYVSAISWLDTNLLANYSKFSRTL